MLTNTAEIIAANNALGYTDEDDDIASIDGASDDASELATDDDIDDDSNGGTDNAADNDEYDLAQIPVEQEFDLALTKVVSTGSLCSG